MARIYTVGCVDWKDTLVVLTSSFEYLLQFIFCIDGGDDEVIGKMDICKSVLGYDSMKVR